MSSARSLACRAAGSWKPGSALLCFSQPGLALGTVKRLRLFKASCFIRGWHFPCFPQLCRVLAWLCAGADGEGLHPSGPFLALQGRGGAEWGERGGRTPSGSFPAGLRRGGHTSHQAACEGVTAPGDPAAAPGPPVFLPFSPCSCALPVTSSASDNLFISPSGWASPFRPGS